MGWYAEWRAHELLKLMGAYRAAKTHFEIEVAYWRWWRRFNEQPGGLPSVPEEARAKLSSGAIQLIYN